MNAKTPPQEADSHEYIYVKWFRHWKTGKVIRASWFGKKAFRLKVKRRSSDQ